MSTVTDTLIDIIACPHDSPGITYFCAHLTGRRTGTQISNNTQAPTVRRRWSSGSCSGLSHPRVDAGASWIQNVAPL